MVKEFICQKCNFKTTNENRYKRHLYDIEYSCEKHVIDNSNYHQYSVHKLNKKRNEFRNRMKKYSNLRKLDASELDRKHIVDEYFYLSQILDCITKETLELKVILDPKYIDQIDKAKTKLNGIFTLLDNKMFNAHHKRKTKKIVNPVLTLDNVTSHDAITNPVLTLENVMKLEKETEPVIQEISKITINDDTKSVASTATSNIIAKKPIISSYASKLFQNVKKTKSISESSEGSNRISGRTISRRR